MKKLILMVLSILFLCGFTTSKTESTGTIPMVENMKTVKYRGHSYIVYSFAKSASGGGGQIHGAYKHGGRGTINPVSGAYGGAGIVHDPDCSCMKEQKALIKKLNQVLSNDTIIQGLIKLGK